jgi:hypothetical protein
MKKLNRSTLIGFVVLGLLAAVGFYLIKNYKSIMKNPNPEFCQASSASWQTPEQCASEQGNYIAADKVCNEEKWLGSKPDEKSVCCVACTDETVAG